MLSSARCCPWAALPPSCHLQYKHLGPHAQLSPTDRMKVSLFAALSLPAQAAMAGTGRRCAALPSRPQSPSAMKVTELGSAPPSAAAARSAPAPAPGAPAGARRPPRCSPSTTAPASRSAPASSSAARAGAEREARRPSVEVGGAGAGCLRGSDQARTPGLAKAGLEAPACREAAAEGDAAPVSSMVAVWLCLTRPGSVWVLESTN